LAVAAIQTVEVRERFCDGIAWIQLGRNALTEKEVRRLYEELFRQAAKEITTIHTMKTRQMTEAKMMNK
jgi:hypothetical protein